MISDSCKACGSTGALMLCSRCQSAAYEYCCKECQKADLTQSTNLIVVRQHRSIIGRRHLSQQQQQQQRDFGGVLGKIRHGWLGPRTKGHASETRDENPWLLWAKRISTGRTMFVRLHEEDPDTNKVLGSVVSPPPHPVRLYSNRSIGLCDLSK
jgi:hypothetical protein